MNSMYFWACVGRSVHWRTPRVELCQPSKSTYSTEHCSSWDNANQQGKVYRVEVCPYVMKICWEACEPLPLRSDVGDANPNGWESVEHID